MAEEFFGSFRHPDEAPNLQMPAATIRSALGGVLQTSMTTGADRLAKAQSCVGRP